MNKAENAGPMLYRILFSSVIWTVRNKSRIAQYPKSILVLSVILCPENVAIRSEKGERKKPRVCSFIQSLHYRWKLIRTNYVSQSALQRWKGPVLYILAFELWLLSMKYSFPFIFKRHWFLTIAGLLLSEAASWTHVQAMHDVALKFLTPGYPTVKTGKIDCSRPAFRTSP